MLRKTLLLAAAALAASSIASAQTVDEIIAKNVAARGGLDKLKALKSVSMTGTMTVGPGIEVPFTLSMKRPKNRRIEFTVQGMTGIQAYDGQTVWMVMPFMGKKDPEAMPAEEAKNADEEADFDGPLVDYAAKGNAVELVGKEQVEGADAYKLKVTLKNGDVRYMFLEAESFLEIRTEGSRTVRGMQVDFESSIGDYKDVEGYKFPFAVEAGVKGSPQKQKMTISKVEINPQIDDALFKMPAKPQAPSQP